MFISSHIMLHEDAPGEGVSWDVIPKRYTKLRFDTLDYLYISPFIVLNDGVTFGMSETGTAAHPAGKFTERLKWVIKEARRQKPKIKIIAMQMNQDGNDFKVLKQPHQRESYAASVATFLRTFEQNSLRIDGYDVDYEWNYSDTIEDGNLQRYSPEILRLVRANLDKLGSTPKFQVSITAASTKGLDGNNDLADVLDFVNMQGYDGGKFVTPSHWFQAIGILPHKLVWGLTAEKPWANAKIIKHVYDVIDMCKTNWTVTRETGSTSVSRTGQPAGFMVWRINSDNWVYENMAVLYLYNRLNSLTSPGDLEAKVNDKWSYGGLDEAILKKTIEMDTRVVLPGYAESDWEKYMKTFYPQILHDAK